MRAENINNGWITVYHGHQDPVTKDHDGKFFSTDIDFAREYGSVSTYQIRLGTVLDTTDEWTAENCIIPLKIEDFEGQLVTMSYWRDYRSETWEIVEHNLDDIVSQYEMLTDRSVDTILITEGGAVNYLVLNAANMRKISEPTREELEENADGQDTIALLQKKYDEFNTKYFYGKLPTIPIRWGKLKTAGAAVYFKVARSRLDPRMRPKVVLSTMEMVFSNQFKRSFEQLIPLLLHEMIHVYIAAVLDDPEEIHGIKFMRELARVSEESGIDVPLTDHTKELELTVPIKSVGVILRKLRDNKFAYALFSENVIRAKLPEIVSYFEHKETTEVRIVRSEKWTRKSVSVPLQRNVGYNTKYWIAPQEDVDDLLNNSIVLYSNASIEEDAYHGTAHEFDTFDGQYVGTGDGALTFGWGIYLAADRSVAKEFAQGIILRVDTPNEETLLHWNAKYDDQPVAVKSALDKMNIRRIINELIRREYITDTTLENSTGEEIYSIVASAVPFRINQSYDKYIKYKKKASKWLLEYGITGIKYKDVVKGRSYNYVVFDPSSIKIIDREYIEPQEEEVYDEYSDEEWR